jgi:type I restriction enzyme, R subunit
VQIVVEHFREKMAPLVNGRAKAMAMIVVGSRVEAVHWQLAIDRYIKNRRYKIRTLLAFSNDVRDDASRIRTRAVLNPNLNGCDIRQVSNTGE